MLTTSSPLAKQCSTTSKIKNDVGVYVFKRRQGTGPKIRTTANTANETKRMEVKQMQQSCWVRTKTIMLAEKRACVRNRNET
jgi:hypothetical protein